jgi:hypothetical protein
MILMRTLLLCLSIGASFLFSPPFLADDLVDVVRDYSCPNDGSRDAAAGINAAMAEADGRSVVVPAGVYLLEDSPRVMWGCGRVFLLISTILLRFPRSRRLIGRR